MKTYTKLISKLVIVLALLCPLINISKGEEVTPKEQKAIINLLYECIKNHAVVINQHPENHDMTILAKRFAQLWTSLDFFDSSITRDKVTFQYGINFFLKQFSSHFDISKSSETLKEFVKSCEAGFEFTESAPPSKYQLFTVTEVTDGGHAQNSGVEVGDTFRLPNEGQDSKIFLNLTDIEEEDYLGCSYILNFYKKDPKDFGSLCLLKGGTKSKCYAHDYMANDEYEKRMGELGSIDEGNLIGIRSFMPSNQEGPSYDGQYISGALEYHIANGTPYITIDLRNNSGGDAGNANHLLSYFAPQGTPYGVAVDRKLWDAFRTTDAYYQITAPFLSEGMPMANESYQELLVKLAGFGASKNPGLIYTTQLEKPLFAGKVAVLINKNTASSAEETAYTLKALLRDRCTIIGEKSAGQVLSNIFDPRYVTSTFSIAYPCTAMIMADGAYLEGKGVYPNIYSEDPNDTLECLEKVREWVN